MAQTHQSPATILIYTYADVVGDGFVKLGFLRDLRARFPHAHITWCSGVLPTVYAGVLKSLTTGYLDEVISAAGIGTGVGELFSLKRPLEGRHFDLVICTDRGVVRASVRAGYATAFSFPPLPVTASPTGVPPRARRAPHIWLITCRRCSTLSHPARKQRPRPALRCRKIFALPPAHS